MHWIYLPFLSQENTLDEVLDQMEVLDSRAVVIAFEYPRLELYHNDSVLEAWGNGAMNAGALTDFQGTRVAMLNGWGFSTQGAESIFESFEAALDREDTLYGLLFPPDQVPGVSLIITRHEGIADEIRDLTRKCVCRPTGDVVDTEKGVGDACDLCDDGTYTRCR